MPDIDKVLNEGIKLVEGAYAEYATSILDGNGYAEAAPSTLIENITQTEGM